VSFGRLVLGQLSFCHFFGHCQSIFCQCLRHLNTDKKCLKNAKKMLKNAKKMLKNAKKMLKKCLKNALKMLKNAKKGIGVQLGREY
jgi:hypothetical protein